jgi:ribosome assembly protein 4
LLTFDNDLQGKLLYTLKDHAHWVTTLALNTDFVLRTGPYDHTSKKPASDAEGIYKLLYFVIG